MYKTFIIIILAFILLYLSGCTPHGEIASTLTNSPVPASTTATEPTPSITSIPDPLTETVIKADFIVLGTITDKKYDIVTIESGNTTGKYTYTIFTLAVEKVIKGDPSTTQVFIKTLGFETDPSYFLLKDKILTLLNHQNDNYYTLAGLQWFESPSIGAHAVVKLQDAIGRILQIMRVNNIPIALPSSEWPPLLAGPTALLPTRN
jgi:hypothetical protein